MPRIEIYTKDWCSYCQAAKQLLQRLGYAYTEYDVTDDERLFQQMRERAPQSRTVPQIFIDERGIGGYTDLVALVRSGALPSAAPS
ncbi:MAG: glutaredoxin 3 [Pseudomonadales bacterium]|jgi:GrxC family glutaredoxin|nr:glutaredoxin 3 [Pseudomonadales bacterium]